MSLYLLKLSDSELETFMSRQCIKHDRDNPVASLIINPQQESQTTSVSSLISDYRKTSIKTLYMSRLNIIHSFQYQLTRFSKLP